MCSCFNRMQVHQCESKQIFSVKLIHNIFMFVHLTSYDNTSFPDFEILHLLKDTYIKEKL